MAKGEGKWNKKGSITDDDMKRLIESTDQARQPYIGVRPLAHGAAACAVTKACALTPPSLALYAPPLLLLPAVPSGHRPG